MKNYTHINRIYPSMLCGGSLLLMALVCAPPATAEVVRVYVPPVTGTMVYHGYGHPNGYYFGGYHNNYRYGGGAYGYRRGAGYPGGTTVHHGGTSYRGGHHGTTVHRSR